MNYPKSTAHDLPIQIFGMFGHLRRSEELTGGILRATGQDKTNHERWTIVDINYRAATYNTSKK